MSVKSRLRAAGFQVVDRTDWTDNESRYTRRAQTHPFPLPARYQFLHLTVTPDTDTLAEGEAGMRQLETYGYSSPPTVSYNWVVTNEGRVFEGQRLDTKGTHTVNDKKVAGFPRDLNKYGHAVALMQNVNDFVSRRQVEAVAAIFAAEQLEGVMKRGAPLYPHRKFAPKDCPGDKAVAQMGSIAWLINKWVADGLPGTPTEKDWFDMSSIADLDKSVSKPWMETSSTLNADGTRSQKTVRQLLVLAADRSYKAARDSAISLAEVRAMQRGDLLDDAARAQIAADVDQVLANQEAAAEAALKAEEA